jgi:uncharacterized protein (DUF2147 family)
MTPSRIAVFASLALALSAGAALASATPVGVWYTQGKQGKVRIAPCGDKLCGVIIAGRGQDGKPASEARDEANPNPALRNRPILGLQILRDFKPTGPGRWGGGKIYDPNTGRTYDSKLSLSAGGVLKVEGCVTVICQSQTWTQAD